MILKVVHCILNKQIENGMISEEDTSVYQYGYTLVLEVMINIIIAIIIGLISRELTSVALFLMMFIPLRSYCGGYHASEGWICIILSNIIVAAIVLVAKGFHLVMGYMPVLIIEVICAVVILLLAPIQSDAKKLSDKEKQAYKKYIRFILIIELFLALIFFCFFEMNKFGLVIVMAHVVQAVSLLAVYLKRKGYGGLVHRKLRG
ncbi:accessory gene regulator B [Kineothrix alysoides]|uniref:Accessory gene regulator B n=1 Tax=Kineothrix alysoides TaxID=1469948 RepID=A0A4R1QUF5_9FIRM|nr:accessory gene regulator B family protein [Kineothrix alysoides]TCL57586.1 accessory gene regulator B [Kineothrix alysoides]